ncbi:hypothetical protein ACJDU8_18360 [Clostridium sp. WILCCON 0269]|uniref:DUF3941 domain-containing protein n=1 Tax=Candidatus Clostridium eludens TaxID=3381663 RepID=A0ABW8SNH0_9CLOT
MSKKNSSSKNHKITENPISTNYARNVKNKAIEHSPYGKDEPSTRTNYK